MSKKRVSCSSHLLKQFLEESYECSLYTTIVFKYNNQKHVIEMYDDNEDYEESMKYVLDSNVYSSYEEFQSSALICGYPLFELPEEIELLSIDGENPAIFDPFNGEENSTKGKYQIEITKRNLLMLAAKEVSILLIIIGIITEVIYAIIEIVNKTPISTILSALLVLTFLFMFLVLAFMLFPIRGLNLLRKQENMFQLNFEEEMRGKTINSVDPFINHDWFVGVNSSKLYIFNKRFVKHIGKFTRDGNIEDDNVKEKAILTTMSGRRIKIVIHPSDKLFKNKLQQWTKENINSYG